MDNAELPNLDREAYDAARGREHITEMARNDYYDGPDDSVVGSKGKTSEEDDDIVGGKANNNE